MDAGRGNGARKLYRGSGPKQRAEAEGRRSWAEEVRAPERIRGMRGRCHRAGAAWPKKRGAAVTARDRALTAKPYSARPRLGA
jgi:hypothetical protein